MFSWRSRSLHWYLKTSWSWRNFDKYGSWRKRNSKIIEKSRIM